LASPLEILIGPQSIFMEHGGTPQHRSLNLVPYPSPFYNLYIPPTDIEHFFVEYLFIYLFQKKEV
jgi:hypothetical protein